MAIAAAVGLLASVTGLYGSYYLDVASGPAMVIVVSTFFGAAFLFAPQQACWPAPARAAGSNGSRWTRTCCARW